MPGRCRTQESQGTIPHARWFGRVGLRGLVFALALATGACGDLTLDQTVDAQQASSPNDDLDGDGRGRLDEMTGYEILVDDKGFGPFLTGDALTRLRVTSDPDLADTDGDGLDDGEEFLIRTDPRNPDTDGDGLTDYEEWNRWFTSPVSIDSDSDARGPDGNQPPNAFLFDGNELRDIGTSPSLADTDGDGRTDYEEIDHAFRSPLVADLPVVGLRVEGDVDMRLFVEYEESLGTQVEYGTSVTTTQSTSSSQSSEAALESSLEISGELSQEISYSTMSFGGKTTLKLGIASGTSETYTTGFTSESSSSLQQESSEVRTSSRDRTEVASSGSIRVPMRLTNAGRAISFRLTDLAVSILRWQPGEDGEPGAFKVLGTLAPPLSGFTLAPGQETALFEVAAENVNPQLLREFFARPDSLLFQPVTFELEDAEGINFAFLTENTFSQTALLEIDFGDGRVESYRVATNVDRLDSTQPGGEENRGFAGLRLGDALTRILEIPYETSDVTLPDGAGGTASRRVITSLRDVVAETPVAGQVPRSLWRLTHSREDQTDASIAIDDARLWAGDQVHLTFILDADGDGLSSAAEDLFGTEDVQDEADDPTDTDGDGLLDSDEIMVGWTAGPVTRPATREDDPYPKTVFSDPTARDTDLDGLTDAEEREARTDPTDPDTDGDGLADGEDLFPLIEAGRLHVDADQGVFTATGLSWTNAFRSLQDALGEARIRRDALRTAVETELGLPSDPLRQDLPELVRQIRDANAGALPPSVETPAAALVSAVWVADGTYRPDFGNGFTFADRFARFELVDGVSIYGGFRGDSDRTDLIEDGETVLDARDPDPLTNGAVLSGDLLGTPGSLTDNSFSVVYGENVGRTAVLDGFLVEGGNADGMLDTEDARGGGILFQDCSATVRNVVVAGNHARVQGGGLFVLGGAPLFEDCVFSANEVTGPRPAGLFGAVGGGGAFVDVGDAVFRGCTFVGNRCPLYFTTLVTVNQSPSQVSDCLFSYVVQEAGSDGVGGGLAAQRTHSLTIEDCRFLSNLGQEGGGIQLAFGARDIAIRRCTFIGNGTSPLNNFSRAYWQDQGRQAVRIQCGADEGWVDVWHDVAGLIYQGHPYGRVGGGISTEARDVVISQCVFSRNEASTGGGISVFTGVATILNCTFSDNHAIAGATAISAPALGTGRGAIENCIFSGADALPVGLDGPLPGDAGLLPGEFGFLRDAAGLQRLPEPLVVAVVSPTALFTVANNLFDVPRDVGLGFGNFVADPGFRGPTDLALLPSSPAVDAGNRFRDFDPLAPGVQAPPAVDVAGRPRLTDGNGDGVADIDLGAYEFQPGTGQIDAGGR